MRFTFLQFNRESPSELQKELRIERILVLCIVGILLVGYTLYFFFLKTPVGFRPETVITISRGESLTTIAKHLQEERVITSPFWFNNLVILQGGEKGIVAGDYIFHEPASIFSLSRRFISGDFELVPVKVTFPEGSNTYDISNILIKKFPVFNGVGFLESAKSKEGYLFPDTYFFFATLKPQAVIDQMSSNFDLKIKPLEGEIVASGHTLHEVLTMASILEAEAKTTEDRKIVAGILWKRLAENMKLQIDTPFKYVNGKTSDELTISDLKMDSPYNTYRYPGLPPTPISNPGLDSISAALHPTPSPYYFFISDRQGNMHYAKNGTEHQKNVKKYLR